MGSDRTTGGNKIMQKEIKEYSMKVDNQELKFTVDEWKCIYSTLKQEIPDIEENFYNSIISNLKNEANKLSNRLSKLSDRSNVNNDYIATIKSLKETLELISKYDWKLNYSEYKVKDDNDNLINQVSIWESNHDNQIRNHKYWNTYGERVDVPNML
jgi:hypothetical protein